MFVVASKLIQTRHPWSKLLSPADWLAFLMFNKNLGPARTNNVWIMKLQGKPIVELSPNTWQEFDSFQVMDHDLKQSAGWQPAAYQRATTGLQPPAGSSDSSTTRVLPPVVRYSKQQPPLTISRISSVVQTDPQNDQPRLAHQSVISVASVARVVPVNAVPVLYQLSNCAKTLSSSTNIDTSFRVCQLPTRISVMAIPAEISTGTPTNIPVIVISCNIG